MASFVPPKFSDLGKTGSELFKKKFDDKKDFKYIVQTKNKTASGLLFTSGGEFCPKSSNLVGSLKVNYKRESFGEVEGSLSTAGPVKAEVKFKKLVQGLTLTVTGDTAPVFAAPSKDPKKPNTFVDPTGKLTAEYSQEFFSGTAAVETSFFAATLLTGSAVIGFDGLSVGGEVKVNTDKVSDVEDYNVGAEYAGGDYTATLKTAEQGNKLTAQYYHRVHPSVQVGGAFTTNLDGEKNPDGSDPRFFTAATEYKVDEKTTVKFRGDTKKVVAVAVEHRLKEPRVQLGACSSWGIVGFSAPNPKDFGFSLTFGDYDEK